MDFKDLLYRAKEGSRDAQEELTRLYHPLLVREAIVDGISDEDLYQELVYTMLLCILKFPYIPTKWE